MKTKKTLLCISFFLTMTICFAQKKNAQKSIINSAYTIKKYHSHEELDAMNKGELIRLYIERIQMLSSTIPYIAFATKPGITMASLGIPDTSDNKKALENESDNTKEYLVNNIEFQKILLPYSDTRNIAKAIYFYEEILKSLYSYDDY